MSHRRSILRAPELHQVAQMKGRFDEGGGGVIQDLPFPDQLHSGEGFVPRETNRTCLKSLTS